MKSQRGRYCAGQNVRQCAWCLYKQSALDSTNMMHGHPRNGSPFVLQRQYVRNAPYVKRPVYVSTLHYTSLHYISLSKSLLFSCFPVSCSILLTVPAFFGLIVFLFSCFLLHFTYCSRVFRTFRTLKSGLAPLLGTSTPCLAVEKTSHTMIHPNKKVRSGSMIPPSHRHFWGRWLKPTLTNLKALAFSRARSPTVKGRLPSPLREVGPWFDSDQGPAHANFYNFGIFK